MHAVLSHMRAIRRSTQILSKMQIKKRDAFAASANAGAENGRCAHGRQSASPPIDMRLHEFSHS
jgi:hypothetical protein